MSAGLEYGETWTYESIVGAFPGVTLSDRAAVGVQFALFQAAVLVLAAVYGLRTAAVAGSVAVIVATVGSAVMLWMGSALRSATLPDAYGRVLFGSSFEVVLAVFAFAALLTHLFVVDPRTASVPLVTALFGSEPPAPAVFLMLLVLWDVCYRIGTVWWVAVVAVWRSYRFEFDGGTAKTLRRVDRMNAGFGLVQLGLVPFVLDRPPLLAALLGHVLAVIGAVGLSLRYLEAG